MRKLDKAQAWWGFFSAGQRHRRQPPSNCTHDVMKTGDHPRRPPKCSLPLATQTSYTKSYLTKMQKMNAHHGKHKATTKIHSSFCFFAIQAAFMWWLWFHLTPEPLSGTVSIPATSIVLSSWSTSMATNKSCCHEKECQLARGAPLHLFRLVTFQELDPMFFKQVIDLFLCKVVLFK